MCFDVTDFTKENLNARKDLASLCDCPLLEAKAIPMGNLSRPRAPYWFKPTARKEILKWIKMLKFPGRYTANIK
jgi:hypothetical protein